MDIEIKNGGNGPDIAAHVDQNNQLHVYSINTDSVQDATNKGNSYNINTGWIGLTSTTASGVFYMLNDEPPINGISTIIIDSIIIGIDSMGTTTSGDPADIVIYRNPTTGTLISGASAVTYKANRNFGSSNTLSTTTLTYKGAEGNTITNGTGFGLISQSQGTRGSYPVNIELPRGASIGITIDTQTTAGTTSVYVAVVCHRKDGKND